MSATEVFASYKPRHRKPWPRFLVDNRDALMDFGWFAYEPKHRAEVAL